ncbi:M55 family metallopeptidase [Pseudothermotoga sp.]|nr:M55 family metallopeptidase [Pseudothermotoga sp.]MCX7813308.1 M55 family metallopeptidase [Pseudothermotoga sp.]MDW8140621.1 M55 family metallopeptidase [Pseudothermotoga sp.]
MKVYISVDMEGLAGIATWSEVDTGKKESSEVLYEHLKPLLEGLFSSGVKIEHVLISDSHGDGTAIPYKICEEFDRVSLVHGPIRKNYMMSGLDGSFDRVIFLGYHAGIGTKNGIMDHTYSSSLIHNIWINKKRMNEALINAAFAAHHGVPVCMIVGDEALEKELKGELVGKYLFVGTKTGLGRYAAVMKPKKQLFESIRNTASQAAGIPRDELPLYKFDSPVELMIEMKDTVYADLAELIPGIERLDGRTIRFVHNEYPVVFNTIMAIVYVAMAGKDWRP